MSIKEPWGKGTPWKNSVAFFTYLRGCLRKAWSNNPIKHNLIKKKRKQIPNPNPKGKKETVWGFDCQLCESTYAINQGQVDHINPAGSLQKTGDIQGFVERLLYVTEEDLRLICKDCNATLALAEKQGISFQEALIEKQTILICKQSAKEIDKWLEEHGVTNYAKNAKSRRSAVREILNERESK